MNQIKRYASCWLSALVMTLCAGCAADDAALTPDDAVPEGMVQVDFEIPGTYGAPLSDLKISRTDAARLPGNIPTDPDPGGTLQPYVPYPIPTGTTLWVAIYEGTPGAADAKFLRTKSYRVSGSSMIPCKVDDEGNVTAQYDTPLYLPTGKYFFRALGPARKLENETSISIDNGQWIISNDERYKQTAVTEGCDATVELTPGNPDRLVHLMPLINQTARLKFTLYAAADDPFVHTLKMQPIGVELSGLQNYYNKNTTDGNPWNWTLCSLADTLFAYPGRKHTAMYLKDPSVSTNERFVIETTILPTDAVATPLIVLFNMEVNGNPTQFEMMLNRKIFRAAYSYHYRGRVHIDDGVTALDWESVAWSADIPFFENPQP